MSGVILYGAPAAGKDTITAELLRLDKGYSLYQKVKVGPGRTTGYRTATPEQADVMRRSGSVVYENSRYNASYLIERQSLSQLLTTGVPVIHLGQAGGIEALRTAFPAERLFVVWLWCSREIAAARIAQRGTGDDEERLRVYDATAAIEADLRINTGDVSAADAAKMIDVAVHAAQDGGET